jgi:hypothetical protein
MFRSNLLHYKNLIKYNQYRYYRPTHYEISTNNINKNIDTEDIKKTHLPEDISDLLKKFETSINNMEKRILENNRIMNDILNHTKRTTHKICESDFKCDEEIK